MINLKRIFGRNARDTIMQSLRFVPDKLYLQMFYLATTGKLINFKNPVGYNEKLQWLKIHDKHPEYGPLVDKLAVRNHIEKVLGKEYLFPLLGYWDSFDAIDFSSLPEQFVLKCNHDSGSTKIIKNKSSLGHAEMEELRKHFSKRLKRDFFFAGREYPYKGIKPYIMAEQMMIDQSNPNSSIEDYKFYCFNGIPEVVLIVTDRNTDCRFDFFDMDYKHLNIIKGHLPSDRTIHKPDKFEEMKSIAKNLAKNKRFVRIDLYEINGQIFFGEYTFFPGGGFQLFNPPEWERKLGDWIDLS